MCALWYVAVISFSSFQLTVILAYSCFQFVSVYCICPYQINRKERKKYINKHNNCASFLVLFVRSKLRYRSAGIDAHLVSRHVSGDGEVIILSCVVINSYLFIYYSSF